MVMQSETPLNCERAKVLESSGVELQVKTLILKWCIEKNRDRSRKCVATQRCEQRQRTWAKLTKQQQWRGILGFLTSEHIKTWSLASDLKCTHALLKVCICSTESVHMLNWIVHMLNWSVYISYSRCVHAILEECTCFTEMCTCSTAVCTSTIEVCICSTEMHTSSYGGVQILYLSVHALVEVCTCSTEVCTCITGSVHMLYWSVHMHYWRVYMLYWKCAHAQLKCAHTELKCIHALLKVCACSTGGVHMLNKSVHMLLLKCVMLN